ncbi:restriction endonuclease subunit S [Bernardetia sp. OM2101]|uniref:restriction endonuclease subunit S n=1 Tax=Bernardetia sp. OM2101 TaxID=3344876 RepID=UPI0035CFE7B0
MLFLGIFNYAQLLITNKNSYNRLFVIKNSTGSSPSMKNINCFTMMISLVPLPPLSEQKAIVEKVEQLMNFCSELEKEIEKSEQYADNLIILSQNNSISCFFTVLSW